MNSIIVDYQSGFSWAQICERNNCSQYQVRKTLSKEKLHSRKQVISSQEISEILDKYKNGLSTLEIASLLGRSKYAVLRTLKKNNITRRTTSEACKIYDLDENAFERVTEESLYWAGFLMADGNLFESKKVSKRIQLALHNRDKSHLEKFKTFLKTNRPLYPDNKGRATKIVISSEKMFDDLLSFGLTPRKSKTAKASKLAESSRHFWRGVIDGDGSLFLNRNKTICLSLVGSKPLLTQYLNFVSRLVSTNASVLKHKSIFEVKLTGSKSSKIIEELYRDCTCYLERKYERAKPILSKT